MTPTNMEDKPARPNNGRTLRDDYAVNIVQAVIMTNPGLSPSNVASLTLEIANAILAKRASDKERHLAQLRARGELLEPEGEDRQPAELRGPGVYTPNPRPSKGGA